MTLPPEAPVRSVVDEQKTLWQVFVVREREATVTDGAARRRDWLRLESSVDRRFIAPIPPGWERWTDRELLAAIRRAYPDLREARR